MESSNITKAVGVWFYAVNTQRYLYLMRCDQKHPNTWGLPGGKVENGESLLAAISRECREELGDMPIYNKLIPLEKFTSTDVKFEFHTFFCSISQEFTPCLNDEHRGYAWIDADTWPRPMHPGLWSTVNLQQTLDKINHVRRQL